MVDDAEKAGHLMSRIQETGVKLADLLDSRDFRKANFANIAYSSIDAEQSEKVGDRIFLILSKLVGKLALTNEEISYAENLGRSYLQDIKSLQIINGKHP